MRSRRARRWLDHRFCTIQHALDSGITFFDTANVYSDGTSKEIVGRALAEYADRDEIMLATKLNELTGDELTELEEPYRPHAVVGFD